MKLIFPVGQAAKICNVAPRTVNKWFDSGRLRGYRISGSQDRRIPREHLIRFLQEQGKPLGVLEEEPVGKILLVGSDKATQEGMTKAISSDGYEIEIALSSDMVKSQAELIYPDCAVIDFLLGREEALEIAKNLRKNREFCDIVLIGLLSKEDFASGIDFSVLDETFRKPFDTSLLCQRIQTLVNSRNEHA